MLYQLAGRSSSGSLPLTMAEMPTERWPTWKHCTSSDQSRQGYLLRLTLFVLPNRPREPVPQSPEIAAHDMARFPCPLTTYGWNSWSSSCAFISVRYFILLRQFVTIRHQPHDELIGGTN